MKSKPPYKSLILVVVQFLCLGYLFLTAPIVAKGIAGAVIQMLGAWFGVWAVWCMKPGNFKISPDVKKGAHLVTNGPYGLIRHPMYLSLFMITAPLVVSYLSGLRIMVFIVFIVNMIVKLLFEEKLLLATFPEYEAYRKRTKRLIPFVW